jgi:hypothetical protein
MSYIMFWSNISELKVRGLSKRQENVVRDYIVAFWYKGDIRSRFAWGSFGAFPAIPGLPCGTDGHARGTFEPLPPRGAGDLRRTSCHLSC